MPAGEPTTLERLRAEGRITPPGASNHPRRHRAAGDNALLTAWNTRGIAT